MQQLDQALALLERNSTGELPPDVRATVRKSLEDFRRCLDGGSITTTAVAVKVVQPALENPAALQPVEGEIVRVHGEEVGTTSAAGTITVQVPPGETTVEAIVYPSQGASTTVNVADRNVVSIELLLDDAAPRERSMLLLDEATEGTLPSTFSSFTLRFVDAAGTLIPMATAEGVDLGRVDGSGFTYWANRFTVAADGTIRPADLAAWRSALERQGGKLELTVSVMDTRGRLHFGRATFIWRVTPLPDVWLRRRRIPL